MPDSGTSGAEPPGADGKIRTVLLVAAERAEFAGLIRQFGRTRHLGWPVDFARQAEARGMRFIMAANGPGPKLAREAVEVALCGSRPDVVVSTGFCGALAPGLASGCIFVASSVRSGSAEYGARAPETQRPFHAGPLVSVSRVISSAAEKRELFAAGAEAVDMEAAAVADRAHESGLPFFCVRVVLDAADEGFCLDFEKLRDAGGRFSRTRISIAALKKPVGAVPELIRLGRNSRRAARALGEFLIDCNF
jgi:adenosylhomocysteine nucleosidase